MGGVFIAPDAAPSLPPFAVIKGGVDAQTACAMQRAVATEMRRTALKGSFAEGGRSCKHVFRFLDEWGSRSVAHKCMNDIFDQVMPLARTFCTDRYISTSATFDSIILSVCAFPALSTLFYCSCCWFA